MLQPLLIVLKIRTIAMPQTRKIIWFVDSCVYKAHQILEMYHVLPYSVDINAPLEY